jgi:predicted acylesterase/phospholipase RssA
MITGKAFITVTLNTTDEKTEILTPFTHPDMSSVDATIFSMNIPFLFYQLVYEGKIYVDGAFANPYPVNYFDDGKTNILGIFMKNKEDDIIMKAKNNILHKIDDSQSLIPFGSYFMKIIQSLINQKRNDILRNCSDKCRHVCLTSLPISMLGKIDVKDKASMIVEGFDEGKKFLQQLKTNTYKQIRLNENTEHYQYPQYYDCPNISKEILTCQDLLYDK